MIDSLDLDDVDKLLFVFISDKSQGTKCGRELYLREQRGQTGDLTLALG